MAGEIVHVEFPSVDADRAQRFWSELFGWSFEDSGMADMEYLADMDYRIASTGEQTTAAVFSCEKHSHSGYPVYYYAVEDIEAARAKIRELGGEAEEKTPVPSMGWLAPCKDSEGNAFQIWQPDSSAA
jgi:predicted enzyme related to lactoylglutathione lyase